jgi:hypothetical protein
MGLSEMVVEVFLALPFFNEMKCSGTVGISHQVIPCASALTPDLGDDLLHFPDKITLSFRQDGTRCIDKDHGVLQLTNPVAVTWIAGPGLRICPEYDGSFVPRYHYFSYCSYYRQIPGGNLLWSGPESVVRTSPGNFPPEKPMIFLPGIR